MVSFLENPNFFFELISRVGVRSLFRKTRFRNNVRFDLARNERNRSFLFNLSTLIFFEGTKFSWMDGRTKACVLEKHKLKKEENRDASGWTRKGEDDGEGPARNGRRKKLQARCGPVSLC